MIGVKHNVPQIQDKLRRIKKLVDGGWQDDAVDQMKKARRMVARLTPKSKGPGPHLRGGWKVHTIGRGGKDRVPVLCVAYNSKTHDAAGRKKKRALLKTAAGVVKDYTLLEILEYGSRAHVIRPVKAKVLHFTTREGVEVFTRQVSHPGTRPYGMVRTTRAKLRHWLKKLQVRWSRKIAGEWGKG